MGIVETNARPLATNRAVPSNETLAKLARLDEARYIDKRQVLWWQFGFEGRRIMTEQEFGKNLMTLTYACWSGNARDMQRRKRSFKIWKGDDVPIMIKKVKMLGLEVECFFSIKPLTHEWPWEGGLGGAIKHQIATEWPVMIYNQPHIRGVKISSDEGFLFWYPLLLGTRPGRFDSLGFRFKTGELALLWAIHPDHFYDNLVKAGWPGGKRAQRKPISMSLAENGLRIVPFYEFDPKQDHIMIYPGRIWGDNRQKLDVPVIVRGHQETGQLEILGAGSLYFGNLFRDVGDAEDRTEGASYWKFANSQTKLAARSLIERLGRIRR